jgi:hypothetical protein
MLQVSQASAGICSSRTAPPLAANFCAALEMEIAPYAVENLWFWHVGSQSNRTLIFQGFHQGSWPEVFGTGSNELLMPRFPRRTRRASKSRSFVEDALASVLAFGIAQRTKVPCMPVESLAKDLKHQLKHALAWAESEVQEPRSANL